MYNPLKGFGSYLKSMLSEGGASSCTRFCVVMVITTIMVNFTFVNIYSMLNGTGPATMNIQEIIALFGMVGAKLGAKVQEKKNGVPKE